MHDPSKSGWTLTHNDFHPNRSDLTRSHAFFPHHLSLSSRKRDLARGMNIRDEFLLQILSHSRTRFTWIMFSVFPTKFLVWVLNVFLDIVNTIILDAFLDMKYEVTIIGSSEVAALRMKFGSKDGMILALWYILSIHWFFSTPSTTQCCIQILSTIGWIRNHWTFYG